jgi:hypothetical protein
MSRQVNFDNDPNAQQGGVSNHYLYIMASVNGAVVRVVFVHCGGTGSSVLGSVTSMMTSTPSSVD